MTDSDKQYQRLHAFLRQYRREGGTIEWNISYSDDENVQIIINGKKK